MTESHAFLRSTELDRTKFPDLRERMAQAEFESSDFPPRSYPGYPRWPLLRVRPRRFKASLEGGAGRPAVRLRVRHCDA